MTIFFPKIEGLDDGLRSMSPNDQHAPAHEIMPAADDTLSRLKKTTAEKNREAKLQTKTDEAVPTAQVEELALHTSRLEDIKIASDQEAEPFKESFLPDEKSLSSALHGMKVSTDLSNCLVPLLHGLAWQGHPRHVAESIPHFLDTLDITSFRNILANLRYESSPVKLSLSDIKPRSMPCLFLPEKGDALVVLGIEGAMIQVFDGGKNAYGEIPQSSLSGDAYIFRQVKIEQKQNIKARIGWFRSVCSRFKGLVNQALGLTLALNLLALAIPLFVMTVYDHVMESGSLQILSYFAIGIVVAVITDVVLRGFRARMLTYIGARIDNIVGSAVFQHILFMPPSFVERETVGAQVARIKDFENIRELFSGPLTLTFIELPFTIIFVIAIAVLGGPVVMVPVFMVALYLLIGLIIQPMIKRSVSKTTKAAYRRQELLVEILRKMRAVKMSAGENKWLERYQEQSASSALNNFFTAQYGSLLQTISSVLMTAAGLATASFGVAQVLDGNMTVGALIACMILVWRILAPVQTAFICAPNMSQFRSSVGRVNSLMNMKAEREAEDVFTPLDRFKGHISFSHVSMNYTAESEPVLDDVSFNVKPGEIVGIVGSNGSGKSTVLKLIAGLYTQQSGTVRIDHQDIDQLDAIELRHAISYVPQTMQFFYGTIAQNLRLTHPTASDDELRWAVNEAGILDEIESLEQGSDKWRRTGFDVRIGDSSTTQMPTSLLQGLNLARAYLKRKPVMLFDEPGSGLNYDGDQQFMQKLQRLKGNTTVLLVTHRPSHMKLVDKIIWMDAGHIRAFGPTDEMLKQMPKNFV